MTKREIAARLKAQHVQHFDVAREAAIRKMQSDPELTNQQILDDVRDLMIRANTVLESATILGVDIARAEINGGMVHLWRHYVNNPITL